MRRDLVAVRLDGSGERGSDAVVWRTKAATPDSPCPVIYQRLLFMISDNGIAQCLDARTGERKWKERLPGDYKASPLAVEGRIYFLSLNGRCTVIEAAATFKRLAENRLPDDFTASPAVSDGNLFLRGRKALYCIGEWGGRK
jgi:outer membrane protein assembly factor BamB